jgi:hypothetical protein
VSVEESRSFQQAVELFQFFLFNEQSEMIKRLTLKPRIERICDNPGFHIPLFKLMFKVVAQKKQNIVVHPSDITKQFIQRHDNEPLVHREGIVEVPGFLTLLLMAEIFEVLKKKIGFLKLENSADEHAEFMSQINQILSLLFKVLSHAYASDLIKESCGYTMLAITDARLKEEITKSLTKKKMANQRTPLSQLKPFFLGKTADYLTKNKHQNAESTFNIVQDTSHSGQTPVEEGLAAAIQDRYFR